MLLTPLADYHQLYLTPAEVFPVFDPARPDELVQVAADRRSLIIVTGIAMGPVTLDIDQAPGPEADHDPADAGAGNTEAASGTLVIDEPLHLLAPTVDTGVTGPVFTPEVAGPHGFSITVDDRRTHYDHFVESPVESYRVRLWKI